MSYPPLSRNLAPIGGQDVIRDTRLVTRRPDVAPAGAAHREAQRVMDPRVRTEDLVVAHEPREDRQTGGVGAGPPGRPEGVRAEIEDRAAAGRRAPTVAADPEELVEEAGPLVDHDRVSVRAALDPVRRHRTDRDRGRSRRRSGSRSRPSRAMTARRRTGSRTTAGRSRGATVSIRRGSRASRSRSSDARAASGCPCSRRCSLGRPCMRCPARRRAPAWRGRWTERHGDDRNRQCEDPSSPQVYRPPRRSR